MIIHTESNTSIPYMLHMFYALEPGDVCLFAVTYRNEKQNDEAQQIW